MKIAVVVLVVVTIFSSAAPVQPSNPVVGIFTDPREECPPDPAPQFPTLECVPSYIPRWLESAGVRVVPIRWNATTEEHIALAQSVNGLVFPGGGLWATVRIEYFTKVSRLVRALLGLDGQAPLQAPVLIGICYGFELLMASLADDWAIIAQGYKGMDPLPIMMSLNFTSAQPASRLFGKSGEGLDHHLVTELGQSPTTLNWHKAGIPPAAWSNPQYLKKGLSRVTPLSTNRAPVGGKQFVSSVESTSGSELYGLQFHPSRALFEFTHPEIGHTDTDIELGQALARFFAARMRLNNNSFTSADDVESHRLAQYPLLDWGWGLRTYWVPSL